MAHYTEHIVRILYEAGDDGLRLRLLSRHVFNAVNSFFEPVERDEVHREVALFVPAHAKGLHPLFLKCSHGVYRLNRHSDEVRKILAAMGITAEQDASLGPVAADPKQLLLFGEEDFD